MEEQYLHTTSLHTHIYHPLETISDVIVIHSEYDASEITTQLVKTTTSFPHLYTAVVKPRSVIANCIHIVYRKSKRKQLLKKTQGKLDESTERSIGLWVFTPTPINVATRFDV